MAAVNGWATRLSAFFSNSSPSRLPRSYPAENTGPSPVMITQRASSVRMCSASPSRISWSSAPRLAGFEILIRATLSAGSSSVSLLLKDHQRVALGDRLALLALDLLDGALVLGLDRHFHLHRLEDHERIALLDLLADRALDLPDGPCDVRFDVRHRRARYWRDPLVTRSRETGTFPRDVAEAAGLQGRSSGRILHAVPRPRAPRPPGSHVPGRAHVPDAVPAAVLPHALHRLGQGAARGPGDHRAEPLLVHGPLLHRRLHAAEGPVHGQVAALQAAA